jgi:hypothetical protein
MTKGPIETGIGSGLVFEKCKWRMLSHGMCHTIGLIQSRIMIPSGHEHHTTVASAKTRKITVLVVSISSRNKKSRIDVTNNTASVTLL